MIPFLNAFAAALQPEALLVIAFGSVFGLIAGAIPGLTGGMTIALFLPVTYYMNSELAIFMLVAMYVGVVTGGLISSTILRMPGTPASVMTTLDGFPMAQRGEAGRALSLGITASFVGGLVSWVFLVLLAPPLARLALAFNHFDYFAMVVLALVMISALGDKSIARGLISGFLGMLLALPGVDPVSAQVRLDFGYMDLSAGLSLLPVLIGLFGVSQMVQDMRDLGNDVERVEISKERIWPRLDDFVRNGWNLLRSSLIGTWIGLLPGIGAAIGSIVAYSLAKIFSKTPEKFGTGHEEGIVASEAANNATIGGALVPLVALGIPGSVVDVILLAALILHGLTPGPMLFSTNPEIAYGVMSSMFIGNIVVLITMLFCVRLFAKVLDIPRHYLLPSVFIFCIIGSFAINNQIFDVFVMLGAGLLGFVMMLAGLPLGPFAIGFILAPLAETSLRSGLMASDGSYAPLVEQPFCAVTLGISAVLFLTPILRQAVTRRFRKAR